MWKYKLGVLLTAAFLIFFLWFTFPTKGKEIKTVTHIVILKHDGDLVEHYMYKKVTTCETINKELIAYRLYGIANGFFVDYFFKCKPYEMIQ